MMKKKKSKVPGPIRIGIALLILGAILVGLGTILNRDALSFYGFIVVVCGFFLYFVSSIYLKKQEKSKIK
jgi:drug/metabolite transporter (DMT)-like permease